MTMVVQHRLNGQRAIVNGSYGYFVWCDCRNSLADNAPENTDTIFETSYENIFYAFVRHLVSEGVIGKTRMPI